MKKKQYYPRDKIIRLFFLLLILIVGAILRLYKLIEWMPWEADGGRDILFAKHLLENKELWLISPPPGGSIMLKNTPLYYWIVGGLYSFSKSPESVLYGFSVLGMVSIICAFGIGYYLNSMFIAYAYAIFTAISYIVIIPSRSILQPNITLPLVNICGMLLLINQRRKSICIGILFIALLFSGIYIHLGFFPAFLFLSIAFIYSLFQTNTQKSLRIILFVLYIICLLASFFLLINWNNIYSGDTTITVIGGNIISNLYSQINYFSSLIFFNATTQNRIGAVIALICIFIIFFIKKSIKLQSLNIFVYGLIALWQLSIFGVFCFYGNTPVFYYFYSYFPIAYLMIVIILDLIQSKIIKILLLIMYLYLSSYASISFLINQPYNDYFVAKKSMDVVVKDYKLKDEEKHHQSFWVVAANEDFYPDIFGMMSEHYWYIIESITGSNFVDVTKDTRNSTAINSKPKYIYVICRVGNIPSTFKSGKICVETMTNKYPTSLEGYIGPIYVATENSVQYSIEIYRYAAFSN